MQAGCGFAQALSHRRCLLNWIVLLGIWQTWKSNGRNVIICKMDVGKRQSLVQENFTRRKGRIMARARCSNLYGGLEALSRSAWSRGKALISVSTVSSPSYCIVCIKSKDKLHNYWMLNRYRALSDYSSNCTATFVARRRTREDER